jgi:hypothetical protein
MILHPTPATWGPIQQHAARKKVASKRKETQHTPRIFIGIPGTASYRASMLRSLLTVAALAVPAYAQTTATWINPAGGSFGNPANWSTGAVPGPADTARFNLGAAYTVVMDANRSLDTLLIAGGTPVIDLSGREVAARFSQSGGDTRLTNGTIRGPFSVLGGTVVIEASAHAVNGAAYYQGGIGVGGTAHVTVRGRLVHGYPPRADLSIGPSASVRLEPGAQLAGYAVSMQGFLNNLGGSIGYDTFDVSGYLNMEGGTLTGAQAAGPMHVTGVARFSSGAQVPANNYGVISSGLTTIEGVGTRVNLARVLDGTTTVRSGANVYFDGYMRPEGLGLLIIGDGGTVETGCYAQHGGTLRLEPGSNVPGLISYDTPLNPTINVVIDPGLAVPFNPARFWGTSSFHSTLDGTLRIELRGGGTLEPRRYVPLFRRGIAPIAGAFQSVIVPADYFSPSSYRMLLIQTPNEVGVMVIQYYCTSDFNQDGDFGTDQDIEAFFACLAGSCCQSCGSPDFNGDGDTGTDADIESFFRVLSGARC